MSSDQGTDIAAARLVDIGRSPVPSAKQPAMPTPLDEELRTLANQQAAETLAAIRSTLGLAAQNPDLPSLLTGFQRQLSWNELVHNSYFEVSGVRDLIVRHVAGVGGEAASGDAAAGAALEPATAERGRPRALLPIVTAILLMLVVGGAHFIATGIIATSVATFTDEYQVDQAIVGHEETFCGSVGGRILDSKDAVGYSHYLLARAAARRGATAKDLMAEIEQIAKQQQESREVYADVVTDLLSAGAAETALEVYRAAPTGVYFEDTTLVELATKLADQGQRRAAGEVADKVVARVDGGQTLSNEELVVALGKAGLPQAFDLAGKRHYEAA